MQIAKLFDRAKPTLSYEFFPPKDSSQADALWQSFDELLEFNPDFVSVTYGAGGSNTTGGIEVLSRMSSAIPTVGHLTCVGSSREHAKGQIAAFTVAGVTNILALRGDSPKNKPEALAQGEMKQALQLVELIAEAGLHAAVAAFPEKHPESVDFEQDLKVLGLKAQAGAEFAMTQLFFDSNHYARLVARARATGVTMPILPGLMPINNLKHVVRMAEMSGAEVPLELLSALEDADDSEARKIGMDFVVSLGERLLEVGAPGLHLFSLNQGQAAAELTTRLGL